MSNQPEMIEDNFPAPTGIEQIASEVALVETACSGGSWGENRKVGPQGGPHQRASAKTRCR